MQFTVSFRPEELVLLSLVGFTVALFFVKRRDNALRQEKQLISELIKEEEESKIILETVSQQVKSMMVLILADNEAAGFKTNTSSTVANTESSSTDEAVDLSSFSLYKERQCPCLLEMEDGIDGIPYVMVEEQQSFL